MFINIQARAEERREVECWMLERISGAEWGGAVLDKIWRSCDSLQEKSGWSVLNIGVLNIDVCARWTIRAGHGETCNISLPLFDKSHTRIELAWNVKHKCNVKYENCWLFCVFFRQFSTFSAFNFFIELLRKENRFKFSSNTLQAIPSSQLSSPLSPSLQIWWHTRPNVACTEILWHQHFLTKRLRKLCNFRKKLTRYIACRLNIGLSIWSWSAN